MTETELSFPWRDLLKKHIEKALVIRPLSKENAEKLDKWLAEGGILGTHDDISVHRDKDNWE